ncbi:MAG: proline--tRNA ligase [Candidatus Woesearchaeota archaeon]
MSKGITVRKEKDFSEWYTQVILKSGLVEYTDVSGCMILRPDSFTLWESVQSFLQAEFDKRGVRNAYFPLFIPEKLLTKEEDHIEGFSAEVAWVTHGGNSELSERLAIRPTSETIMYPAYSKWIQSHRDLPLKLNQWCNVVRWEFKHPRPFLRTREFLWQEGHTAYADAQEAKDEVQDIIELYARVYEELMAVPVLVGRKSEAEKFAGADYTLSIESLFPDGKAIQACTSHYLGQNFSKAFDITFLDENGDKQFVYQNSWGFTTRSIGVMLGVHGDDKGLVLPPRIARMKAVLVPIVFSKDPEGSKKVLAKAKALCEEFGWHLDDRDNYSPGHKFSEWELKGIPLRIELGPRDLEKQQVVVARRDTSEKQTVSFNKLKTVIPTLLEDIQQSLYEKAKAHLDSSIVEVTSLEELKRVVEEKKIAKAVWCGTSSSEARIKEVTGAKSLTSAGEESGVCFESGEKASIAYYFGKSY